MKCYFFIPLTTNSNLTCNEFKCYRNCISIKFKQKQTNCFFYEEQQTSSLQMSYKYAFYENMQIDKIIICLWPHSSFAIQKKIKKNYKRQLWNEMEYKGKLQMFCLKDSNQSEILSNLLYIFTRISKVGLHENLFICQLLCYRNSLI